MTQSERAQDIIGALPIINLRDPAGSTDRDEAPIARDVGNAARGLGFFYIAEHGIPTGVIDGAFAAARQFFALAADRKEALSITANLDNRGYVGLKVESLDPADRPDMKEALNVVLARGPDGQDPNHWPDLPGFKASVERYRDEIRALSARVHRLFALDLGLKPDFFDPFFSNPMATLRLLHYPSVPRIDRQEPGAGAHTDYGNITLLAQDSVGGLEVRRRDGRWICAPPVPNTFVCNIGDCLMRWSNDTYVSNPHRVVSPVEQERYSIAYFSDPDSDADIRCLPGCSSAANPPRYAPIAAAEYLRQRFEATYAYRRAAAGARPAAREGISG